MGPEAKVEAYLVKRVRETKGRVRKLKWIGRNGAPDRLVWWPGMPPLMFFVELKSKNGKVSPLQGREHAKLEKDGFEVLVLHTKERIDMLIKNTEIRRSVL